MPARSVAVAIICKTPAPGLSKTRLSPPLKPEECAGISACFIRDLAATIGGLSRDGDVTPYVVYTPVGSETALKTLLPDHFKLVPQAEGDLGMRLRRGFDDLFKAGHAGAIFVNSDSPTLPAAVLRAAVDAVKAGDALVLSPALDGGYTLVGLSQQHEGVFADIPWSTPEVYPLTLERAREIGLPVVNVHAWYDVDDAETLQLLETELAGQRLDFWEPGITGSDAKATCQFLRQRAERLGAGTRTSSNA